ncbi:MAG TPA: PAS domain S-box protein [Bacteroidales bacterium]|nr:PAS domain S-box protein [Bacteroidales bacterium]HSA42521.1 PAS domain S-box protein [Bacteroidales bacterium]
MTNKQHSPTNSQHSESVYQQLIQSMNLSVWEAGLGGVKEYLDELLQQHGKGLRDYIDQHPEIITQVIPKIHFLDVNTFTLELFAAVSREDLFVSFPRIIAPESWPVVVDILLAIAGGDMTFSAETTVVSLDGEKFPVLLRAILHQGDHDYSHSLWGIIDIAEQKGSEEEVKRSEERLRMILKAIPDLIFLFDRDGYYLDYWATDHSKLALPADRIVGTHLSDIFPGETVGMVLQAFQECLDTREIRYIQYDIDLPVGQRYFEARIVPAGEHEVITLAMDVTERKLAEQAVKKSEQQYKELLDRANDAILIIDPESEQICSANTRAVEIYGFSRDELLQMSLKDLTKDVAKGRTQIARTLVNNGFRNFETIHYNSSGQEIHMLVNGSMVEFEGVQRLLIINHDITELKKAEHLRNATYRIADIALSSGSMDEMYRSIHSIIEALMPAKNIYFAYYDQDVDMLSFPYFVDEHDYPPSPRRMKKGLTEYVLRTAKPVLATQSLINNLVSKGELEVMGTLTYDWLGVPLKTKDRTIGALVVQSYEKAVRYTETDKKILIFVSGQVAMAVDRWTKEEELRKAKETAEESSKLKSTLLANLSHEFRTPMNAILNYSRLLREHLKGDSMEEMADTIYTSGHRLMATLDSIMYLAQIEASNIKLEIRRLDIRQEIAGTLAQFEAEAAEKGLQFELIASEAVFAFCDRTLLNQITSYLLDNAVKFTLKGKITVRISSQLLGGKYWAELAISDTGIGIARSDYEAVFHEFRQLSSGYGRTHEGSGLGLTLSKKMAELMNGRILIDSSLGKGSTFHVRFPQAREAPVNGESRARIMKAAEEQPRSRPVKPEGASLPEILIVEDNQVNIELTVMFLKDICRMDVARDGQTAVRMASMKPYQAILMDINLGPGMNGLQAALEIRKLPGYTDIPIVAVTGYTMSGDREKMLSGGCSHYLPKPFDKKGIVKMVQDVLNESAVET